MDIEIKRNVKNLITDSITGEVYITIEKSPGVFDFFKAKYFEFVDVNSNLFVNAIFKDYILSIQEECCSIYYFEENTWRLLKQLPIKNFRLSNCLTRLYSEIFHNNRFFLRCFDTVNFDKLFEFEYVRLGVNLLYHEDNIIIRSRDGTELYFYKDDRLLFKKIIPLSSNKDNTGRKKDRQDFTTIALFRNELICNVNNDKIISIDITNGEILWTLIVATHAESSRKINIGTIAMYGVEDSIIYMLQGFILMKIDLISHNANVLKDFRDSPSGENLWFHAAQFYNGRFYFIADIGFNSWTYSMVGIFDVQNQKVLWNTTVHLSPGAMLQKPVVDDSHIYVRDNLENLYIFSNEGV